MQTRASVCCLGMANVFGIVVDEEGWWWWARQSGAAALQALHQLRCQAMTTRAPALIYCTRYGHGKVQQHIKGPSV